MIVLGSTLESVTAVLSGAAATNNPEYTSAYADRTASAFTPAGGFGALNGTSSVDLVPAPSSGAVRTVRSITVCNRDSAAVTLTVRKTVSGMHYYIHGPVVLEVGDTWQLDEDGIKVVDAAGAVKTAVGAVAWGSITGTLSAQTDLQTVLDTKLTASSAATLTNKTIDANDTGNSISNLEVADFASGVADTDGTLAANSDSRLATQKATKTYVDGLLTGLSWKKAVRVATTANGTLATAFENGDAVDGVTLATGDRILIKNQSTAAENGIYIVAASGAPSRASDADSGAELVNAAVYVSEGTTNADTGWVCTTNATITPGSTSLTFVQFSGTGSLNLNGLSAADGSLVYEDEVPVYDISASANRKRTVKNILGPTMMVPGGRLTLTTGTPVTTGDVTGAGTIYYECYLNQNYCIWTGSEYHFWPIAGLSLSLSGLTSGKNYDVFLSYNSGNPILTKSAAWTDDVTRADALAYVDGVLVKSSDHTQMYLGTFRATGTGTTEDSEGNRFVWNTYNRVPRRLFACPGYNNNSAQTTWTSTATSYGEANGGTGNKFYWVQGEAGFVPVGCAVEAVSLASTFLRSGIGLDSTTTAACAISGSAAAGNALNLSMPPTAHAFAAGYHYAALLVCLSTAGTATFNADQVRAGSSADPKTTYLTGTILA